MTHIHPTKSDFTHKFICNYCGKIAGEHTNEHQALQLARDVVKMGGWLWFHPGWGLICPECLIYQENL